MDALVYSAHKQQLFRLMPTRQEAPTSYAEFFFFYSNGIDSGHVRKADRTWNVGHFVIDAVVRYNVVVACGKPALPPMGWNLEYIGWSN